TALHYAAQKGHEAVVRLLLDRGANIEAKCKFTDSTALHDAALYGHVAVTELLLDRGADTEARGVDGKTAM
ncbi:ankyrin, partial [Cenococcum geophilum 1.58]|uniref:ankyrin n=1 Tax=Cenococcum geophilum 1.58 TaxID=794803 RepID=UPI00358F8DDB